VTRAKGDMRLRGDLQQRGNGGAALKLKKALADQSGEENDPFCVNPLKIAKKGRRNGNFKKVLFVALRVEK